jgi:hypothetical protein
MEQVIPITGVIASRFILSRIQTNPSVFWTVSG